MQINPNTRLGQCFEEREKFQRQISELNNQIEQLMKKRRPLDKEIRACVKCNGGLVTCGPYKAMLVPTKGHVVAPGFSLKITRGSGV